VQGKWLVEICFNRPGIADNGRRVIRRELFSLQSGANARYENGLNLCETRHFAARSPSERIFRRYVWTDDAPREARLF
jgi:hypothetical protein